MPGRENHLWKIIEDIGRAREHYLIYIDIDPK